MLSVRYLRSLTLIILTAAALIGLNACRKGVDLNSGAPASTSSTPVDSAASTPTPTPTPPNQPAASASPVKPGEVPDMMKRAFTKEEMDKAMQQLPPEIRDRLKGLSYAPSNIPAPTPAKPPAKKQ